MTAALSGRYNLDGRQAADSLRTRQHHVVLYRFVLSREEPDRHLFLALPRDAHEVLFDTADGRDLVAAQALRLLVFDPVQEVIVQWIE